MDLYDPVGDRWTPQAPLPAPRADAKAVLLADGSVLVVTGFSAPAAAEGTPDCPAREISVLRYVPG